MHPTTMTVPMRGVLLSTRATATPSSLALVHPKSQTTIHQQRRYRTHASSPLPSSSSPSSTISRKSSSHLRRLPPSTSLQRRNASTRTSPSNPTPSSPSSTSTTSTNGANSLDWNSFFALRATRRRYNLASSITTSLTTTGLGISVLSTQDLDSFGTQIFGLDPFVVLGLMTAGFGAIGWLVGPFLGGAIWSAMNRGRRGLFAAKEKQFYARIKAHRVDPSTNSFQNPVPDYYGEKIGSVTGYRHWLKDQRAYNRKRKVL